MCKKKEKENDTTYTNGQSFCCARQQSDLITPNQNTIKFIFYSLSLIRRGKVNSFASCDEKLRGAISYSNEGKYFA